MRQVLSGQGTVVEESPIFSNEPGLRDWHVLLVVREGLPYERAFSTHIEVFKEDGSTMLILGHYDLDEKSAQRSFRLRSKQDGYAMQGGMMQREQERAR